MDKPLCQHCRLAAADSSGYCCYGCSLAAELMADGKGDRGKLYGVFTFSLLLSMIVMMLSLFLFAEDVYQDGASAGLAPLRGLYRVASGALATPVVALLGAPLVKRLLHERRLSMELFIVVSAGAAYLLSIANLALGRRGVYFDSATSALVLATLGRYLEASARAKASLVIAPSVNGGGERAILDEGGAQRPIDTASIEEGMTLIVPVETTLPVDAKVIEPVELNLGVLTGVAAPVLRRPGDEVPAGAIPISGPLRCVALRAARASTLERLAALAKSLGDRRGKLLRLADTFAALLVPFVGVAAASAALYHARRSGAGEATVAALAVVLAACPCTYGVSTPLVLWIALRKALSRGVVIRNAAAIEEIASVKRVAFDKTGTLTHDDLDVIGADVAPSADPAEVAALVLALEEGRGHPVARALVKWAQKRAGAVPHLTSKEHVVGSGVLAIDEGGREIRLGSARWVGLSGARAPRVVLTRGGEALARFDVGERQRADAAPAVAALHELGVEVEIVTGDSSEATAAFAKVLGVAAFASLSPEDKVAHLARAGAQTAFVGDGLNDAPALAAAGPSFAVERGTALSRGMARVGLLRDDLTLVPWTIGLCRRAVRAAKQNLVLSTVYNIAFVGLAASGALKPVWAGVSMLTASLMTLLLGLRVGMGDQTPDEPDGAPAGATAEARS